MHWIKGLGVIRLHAPPLRAADSVHYPLFSYELSRSFSRLWTWRSHSSSRTRGKGTAPEADPRHGAAGLQVKSERVGYSFGPAAASAPHVNALHHELRCVL